MMETGIKSWAEKEVEIACKRERELSGSTDEWVYGCACYDSALKAYRSLMEDGHSGMSIGLTQQILNRLLESKPLTPIEDTEDDWYEVSQFNGSDEELASHYQCKRMSSLFKYVSSDGSVSYKDINAYTFIYVDNPNVAWHNSFLSEVLHEMFPITMPYYPEGTRKVFCKELLTDSQNGDYDTICIFHALGPNGERISVNRYFKEDDGKWVEIDVTEYKERKKLARKLISEYFKENSNE